MKRNSNVMFCLLILLLISSDALAVLGVGDTAIVSDPILEDATAAAAVVAANTAASAAASAESGHANLLQAVESYAKETLMYQQQLIDTEMLVRDIEEHPLEMIIPDANKLIANQVKINKLAQSIDAAAPNVGENLVKDIRYPRTLGLGQGSKFQLWSDARQKAVQDTLDSVTEFRKDYFDDNKDIMTALRNIGHANGRTAAMKAAAFAAGQQAKNAANMVVLLNEARRNAALREAAALSEAAENEQGHQRMLGTNPYQAGAMPPDRNHTVIHGLHL